MAMSEEGFPLHFSARSVFIHDSMFPHLHELPGLSPAPPPPPWPLRDVLGARGRGGGVLLGGGGGEVEAEVLQPRVVEVVRVLPRLVPALVTAAPCVPMDGDGKVKMSITMRSRDKHPVGSHNFDMIFPCLVSGCCQRKKQGLFC